MTADEPARPATDDAIEAVLRALRDIHETIPRCSRCENHLAVVAQVRLELDGVAGARAAAARDQLDAWIAEAEARVKTSSNCEVCVPRGPFERFIAALALGRERDREQARGQERETPEPA
jgi:hypothetical protein